MSTQEKTKLLSILCYGRNDSYMGNFIWRLSTVLNKICGDISCLGAEDEIELLVCDWGSDEPLHRSLELSEQARSMTRFLVVPPDVAETYHKDAGFSGVHAVNAVARRAKGRYLLFSDSDVFVPLETMAKLLHYLRAGYLHSYSLTDSFFWASKYHIPNDFISQSPCVEFLEDHIRKNWTSYVHETVDPHNFLGSGVALLMSRDMWHESRGVDEKLIYMGWNDIDFTRRLMWKYRMDDLENHGLIFFHLEHYRDRFNQNYAQENKKKLNPYVEPTQFAANQENWGLGDHQLQVVDGFGMPLGPGYPGASSFVHHDWTRKISSVRETVSSNPLYRNIAARFEFAPHSWFTNDEPLRVLMETLKPRTICEVGSWMGASARFMASFASAESIVCVDHWDRRRVEKYEPGVLPEMMLNNLYEHFLANAVHAGIDDRIYPLRLDSRQAAQYCREQGYTFDLIYIDGDHTTVGARNDILMWYPLVAPGGILCGDDWSWQKEPDNVAGAVITVAKALDWQIYYYGNFWLALPGGFGVQELTGEVFTRIKPIASGKSSKPSELDQIIPPEITGDELYFLIEKLTREEQLTNVLEIGSSAGGGSTEAFVKGLRSNSGAPRLFCMEVSKPRFSELTQRYADDSFVHPYNVSSVPPVLFPAEREVELFYNHVPTALNEYPLDQVLGWLKQDLDYIRDAGVETDGIELIRRENGIDRFDMVLIDGSEFTGKAELDKVYGARIILLDDINGFKNYANYKRLIDDPSYQLIAENWQLRNGYAAFRRMENQQELPIHLLTIVLNGEPFIRHHIEAFKALPFPWHWHIVEGVADLKRDTAWSLQFGGRITDELHAAGRSNDGTSAYLDQLAAAFPQNITVYRKPSGVFWDGKVEMVNAPLPRITEQCLLWQLDSDELWTAEQIVAMRELFLQNPQKTAAYFHCDYFVGTNKYVSSLNTWATYPKDWIRVWRFAPGMSWAAHEPPVLVDGQGRNVAEINAFSRDETMSRGITFQHFAYATEEQVRFKEIYYGYTNAVAHWRELQKTTGPVNPARYLPWAKNDATVDDWPAAKRPLLAAPFFALQGHKANQEQKDYFSMAVDGATLFEAELRRLFQQIRPATIIETGTYLGQGTSSIIWRALKDFAIPADFTTIEVNPVHHVQALNHFRQNGMQINAELGLTLPRNLLPNQEEIAEKFIRNKEYEGIYYDHDEADRAQYYYAETNFDVPENLLYKIMERYHFRPAFVLLDSAGHLGFAEFQYFMTLIKWDCYLMLDDIYHCKHYKTLQVIKKDPRFQILVESGEKFGFCIVKYTHVKSVLFVRPDSIGDNVLAAAMLPHIKGKYPDAAVTVVCREHVAEIYEACPGVSEVIGFDRDQAYDNEDYRNLMLQRLQAVQPDLALNSLYSRELVGELFTIGSGARVTVAFDGNLCNMTAEQRQTCDPNYTRLITADPTPKREIERNREFLQAIGIDAPPLQPTVWLTDEDERFAEDFFRSHKLEKEKTIALFAVGQWGQKVYDRYGEALAELCQDQGFTVIAFGAAGDKEINERILNGLGCRTINMAGETSLRQAAALLKRCRLGVGADTGTAHLACAVGIPNVVMLGGGHFGRFFPYSPLTSVVCLPLDCYHCNWECRYARSHCIKDIEPQVLEAAVNATLTGITDKPRIFAAGEGFRQSQPGEPASRQLRDFVDPAAVSMVTVAKPATAAKFPLEVMEHDGRQAVRHKVAGKR